MSELEVAREEQRRSARALYDLYKDPSRKSLRPLLREKLNPPGVPRSERPLRDLPLRSRLAYAIGRILSFGRTGPDIRTEQQQAQQRMDYFQQRQAAMRQDGLRPVQQPAEPAQEPALTGAQDPGSQPTPGPAQFDPLAEIQQELDQLRQRIEAITAQVANVDYLVDEHAAAKQKAGVFAELADLGAAVRKERDRSIRIGDNPAVAEFAFAAQRHQTELTMLQQEALRQQGIDPENSEAARQIFGADPPPAEEVVAQAGRPEGRTFGRQTRDAERILLAAAMRDEDVHRAVGKLLPELSFSPQARNAFLALDQIRTSGDPVSAAKVDAGDLESAQSALAQSEGIPAGELYTAKDLDRIAALEVDNGTDLRAAAGVVARDYQTALSDAHEQAQAGFLANSDGRAANGQERGSASMNTVDRFAEQQKAAKANVVLQEHVANQLLDAQQDVGEAVKHGVVGGGGRRGRPSAAFRAGAALAAPASAATGPAAETTGTEVGRHRSTAGRRTTTPQRR